MLKKTHSRRNQSLASLLLGGSAFLAIAALSFARTKSRAASAAGDDGSEGTSDVVMA